MSLLRLDRKIVLWMNMPSHHQRDFIEHVIKCGAELRVRYYGEVTKDRIKQGWNGSRSMALYEKQVGQSLDFDDGLELPDWKECVHIVPGNGSKFLRALVNKFIKYNVIWLHWSEPSHPGIKRVLGWPYKYFYARKINKYSSGALAIGTAAKLDFIRWGVDLEKIKMLPYSINPLVINKCDKYGYLKDKSKINILYLGQLCKRKGIDLLIEAFKNLNYEKEHAKLVLVGLDRSKGKYLNQILKYKLEDKIKVESPVSFDDIPLVLDQADIVILPSRFDGWGMIINEATSIGKPVIATTAVGSSNHLIKDKVNGRIAKPNDAESLTECMEYLMKNKDKLLKYGKQSKIIFDENSAEVYAQKLIEILKSV